MINNQAYLFLIFTLNGIIIGLLFDCFRILRKTIKTNNLFTYIEDVIFWLLTGVLILYSIYYFNNGQIRLYMFLGIILGTILYLLTISKYVISIFVNVINFIKKILGWLINLLLLPFKFIFGIFKKILLKPINFFIINLKNIKTKTLLKIKFLKKEQKNNKKRPKNIFFKNKTKK